MEEKLSCFWCDNKGEYTKSELVEHTKKEHEGLYPRSYDIKQKETMSFEEMVKTVITKTIC